jgi:hypothetical protein
VRCQINSYKSIVDRLNALERKGYIKRVANKHRGIRVLRKALTLQAVTVDAASAPLPDSPTAFDTTEGVPA